MTAPDADPPTALPRPPLVHELTSPPDPRDALRRFADLDGVTLLESAARRPRLGRHSFLTAEPFRRFLVERVTHSVDPLRPIADAMTPFGIETVADLPPFQGGAVGLLGYEAGGAWERLTPRPEEGEFLSLAAGLYDWTIAWDHEAGRAWVIVQDFTSAGFGVPPERASARLRWALDRLRRSIDAEPPAKHSDTNEAAWKLGVSGSFSREDYIRTVERVVEYIRAGDIFQANLSRQIVTQMDLSPVELYARLRAVNPAPFAGYYAGDDWAVVSASPERFLEVRGDEVETRPIKGTRPRSADPAEDARLRAELLASEKDRAENVMIVDLLRNDLSRVCRPGSVVVPELCVPESYETVHHLVSSVRGRLEPGRTAWDLFAAAFPGGSITGAPKVRAMEILRELEPTARGPYCGSLFYVGFDGSADSNILIRTMAVRGREVRIGVGGGVTAASDPEAEYEETRHKAAAMLRAVGVNGEV